MIKKPEQYVAIHDVFSVLEDLGLKGARQTRQEFVNEHVDEWGTCDNCDQLNPDCSCDYEYDYYDYENYDDEDDDDASLK